MHVPKRVYHVVMGVHCRFTGVCWHKKMRLWFAYINDVYDPATASARQISLGFFAKEEEAAKIVDKHLRQRVCHFGAVKSPLPQAARCCCFVSVLVRQCNTLQYCAMMTCVTGLQACLQYIFKVVYCHCRVKRLSISH